MGQIVPTAPASKDINGVHLIDYNLCARTEMFYNGDTDHPNFDSCIFDWNRNVICWSFEGQESTVSLR